MSKMLVVRVIVPAGVRVVVVSEGQNYQDTVEWMFLKQSVRNLKAETQLSLIWESGHFKRFFEVEKNQALVLKRALYAYARKVGSLEEMRQAVLNQVHMRNIGPDSQSILKALLFG